MALGLVGKKLGMTQVNDGDQGRVAVTLLEVGPCLVVQKKTQERDGYTALALGFGEKKAKRTPKAQRAIFDKLKAAPKRWICEFRVSAEELGKYEEGQEIKLDQLFSTGQKVDVVGYSKGRGFSGVMKRWRFKGFDATHGTHEYFRHGGSIGTRKTPGWVQKNTKMPGRLGNQRTTTRKLRVVNLLEDKNCLLVEGSVPGSANSYIEIVPSK